MKGAGATARQGLILGLAGVEAGAMLAAGAVRHAGWWLDWHMGAASRDAADVENAMQKAALRLMHAA